VCCMCDVCVSVCCLCDVCVSVCCLCDVCVSVCCLCDVCVSVCCLGFRVPFYSNKGWIRVWVYVCVCMGVRECVCVDVCVSVSCSLLQQQRIPQLAPFVPLHLFRYMHTILINYIRSYISVTFT